MTSSNLPMMFVHFLRVCFFFVFLKSELIDGMFCGNGVAGITLTKLHYVALHYIYVSLSWSKSSIPQGQSLNCENNLQLLPNDTTLSVFHSTFSKRELTSTCWRFWLKSCCQSHHSEPFEWLHVSSVERGWKFKYGISMLLLHCRWIELFPSVTLGNGYANWKISPGNRDLCSGR